MLQVHFLITPSQTSLQLRKNETEQNRTMLWHVLPLTLQRGSCEKGHSNYISVDRSTKDASPCYNKFWFIERILRETINIIQWFFFLLMSNGDTLLNRLCVKDTKYVISSTFSHHSVSCSSTPTASAKCFLIIQCGCSEPTHSREHFTAPKNLRWSHWSCWEFTEGMILLNFPYISPSLAATPLAVAPLLQLQGGA